MGNINPERQVEENVSRETFAKLKTYESLLVSWNKKVNLVAESTISHLWSRHFIDSMQLLNYAPVEMKWLDIGSGAGFPGLVLAVIAKEKQPNAEFVLIEPSSKKRRFLGVVAKQIGIQVKVLGMKCENVEPQRANIVTARAVAPLPKLLKMTVRHLAKNGTLIFPKGRNRELEIKAARSEWNFDLEEIPSVTDQKSAILIIRDARHE